MQRFNWKNQENEQRRSQIGSQLPEEFYDYLDQQGLIRNDRFLKRFGKRLFGAFHLKRNQSNITLLDAEIDSNFSQLVTPKRAFSLLGERTLLSKKKHSSREKLNMGDLEFKNKILKGKIANGGDILLTGENITTIELPKENGENCFDNLGNIGFGFNIVGGSDQHHIPGDPGIFISMINNGTAASRDRRLKIGDRIISVNGVPLAGKTRDGALQILRNAKGTAVLVIEQNAESRVLNQPTELWGLSSSNENTSSLSPGQSTFISPKSLGTSLSRTMPDSTQVEKENESPMSPYKEVVNLALNSTNDDNVNSKNITKNEARNQNEVYSAEHGQILEIGSVTTASPLTPLKDETAKSIDERSEELISVINADTHVVNDDYDYEDENALSCDHSSTVIDDVPVTPKRPYRLLDPSNPSIVNEVLAVSAGIAALGIGIYVAYRCVRCRSTP